jgi:hypothetical protein
MQQGITPITPDIGITMLQRLIAQPLPMTSVVVTGRFGEAPTLKLEQPELPFLRFAFLSSQGFITPVWNWLLMSSCRSTTIPI